LKRNCEFSCGQPKAIPWLWRLDTPQKDGLFTNRLLWLGASAGALPLRGSGCRNLALPGVCEQAFSFLLRCHQLNEAMFPLHIPLSGVFFA
jgi:hypothetical protein